ncbi:AP-4 complex subunit beta-1, partial [Mortierella polycephala]
SDIVDLLYGLLRDRDTQVVVNAILALETILVDEGGIVINHNIVAHLIQRYKDWNSNQLQIILGVLCRYKPRTDDEIYEVMVNCTGKLRVNSQQHLQAMFCSINDPVVIKLQKLSVCARIAQSSDPTTTLFILDNLCMVASMSHLTTLLKASRTKLERHTISGHLEVSCRAIEAIGQIGSQYQLQGQPTQADVLKTCHDRLFQLLILFSDTEQVYYEHSGRKGDQRKSKGMPVDWKHSEIAELELEDTQVSRLLSTLLIAIEDQEELDRRAKKKKPLRYRYEHDDGSASSMGNSSTLHQEHPGDISRRARISGIRMLLLEESYQQLVLRKQLLDSSDSLIDSDSPDTEKRCQHIKAALEMRMQYALLLQQQVQDLVQSIDQSYTTTSTTVAAPSDRHILRARNEQLAALHLACHLVAFSIEHEDALQPDQALFRQRLDILAQAVGQLIPEQSPTGSPLGDSLVAFDNGDSPSGIEGRLNKPKAVERTEKYQQLVKQKFAIQFGIKGRNSTANIDKNDRDAILVNNIDMSSLLHQDWLLQVGFNTLTAMK